MTRSDRITTTSSGSPCGGAATAPCGCEGGRSEDLAVNPFVDLRVAYGMLLGADDFRVLMGNPRGKLMLHNAWLHGTGVVWGYPVGCGDDRTLTIGPGLALDGIGRELLNRTTECDDLYELARELIEAGPQKRTSHDHEGCCQGEEKDPAKPTPGCESWSVHACLVATFDTCLTAAVPTVQDPCDVTRKHDDYSRVVERVRFELLPGCCRRSCCGYHRVRVLLGLEDVGPDDDAGAEAAAARAAVEGLPAADRAAALARALQRMATSDSIDRRPEGDPGPCEVSVFPVDEEESSVPLACVRFTVVERDGCTIIEDVCVDTSVRTTLLPTCVVQDLTCGLAPALAGDEDEPCIRGPQVVCADVAVEAAGRRIVLPVTAPLMVASVPGGVRVHTLSSRRSEGWERQTVDSARYDPVRQAIVVRLVDRLGDELVRVVVAGSGDRPVMGLDPLLPLEGVVGDRPQSHFDGVDAVCTFPFEPPPEPVDEVVEVDVVEIVLDEDHDDHDDHERPPRARGPRRSRRHRRGGHGMTTSSPCSGCGGSGGTTVTHGGQAGARSVTARATDQPAASTAFGPGFTSLNPVDGLFLRATHLETMQDYARAFTMAVGRAAGAGVVYGYAVRLEEKAAYLDIAPGLAINGLGRPLLSTTAIRVAVPDTTNVADASSAYWVIRVCAAQHLSGCENRYGSLCDDTCGGEGRRSRLCATRASPSSCWRHRCRRWARLPSSTGATSWRRRTSSPSASRAGRG